MLCRTSSPAVTTSYPATFALPPVGGRRVQSIRTVVDLPAPFGPRKPKISPSFTFRSTPRTASIPPLNVRDSSRASMAGGTPLFSINSLFRPWVFPVSDGRAGQGSSVAPSSHSTYSLTSAAVSEAERAYLQDNQPDGVPPLELTGERTLPDVPEENYWYRRHVAVYEW